MAIFVGIDVRAEHRAVAVWEEKNVRRFTNSAAGQQALLVKRSCRARRS